VESGGVEFEQRVSAIVVRLAAQAGRVVERGAVTRLAAQLAGVVAERGLPAPLPAGKRGRPGGMSEAECAPWVARVMEGLDDPLLADAARQLVKACFYPEFLDCRDSYREVARDGACRRQEAARAGGRISGAHCVDCPHWVALDPEAHRALLRREWRGDPAGFDAARDVFLPEDFRALRHWLHAAAREFR
jgi:hypothetical protein